jgi:hypothetical protein
MQVVDWISTGGWSDTPRCVHMHIQAAAVIANDSETNEGRQKLLDLIPRMMGTNNQDLDVKLWDCINAFNTRWFGADWEARHKDDVTFGLPEYKAHHLTELLVKMLDVADKQLGRTKHEPVDLTDVCAAMATI